MSCEQTTKAYEAACDRFFDMLDDHAFHALIYEHFLSHMDQWKEKEFGFSEYPYENAFDYLWEWDCEWVYDDIKDCVDAYIAIKQEGEYQK